MLYKESLEDELIKRHEQLEVLTDTLIEMFDEAGFTQEIQINGINFNSTQNGIFASFYIDTNLNYKGYITSNTSVKSNYSISGNKDNVIEAADKFIDLFFLEVD